MHRRRAAQQSEEEISNDELESTESEGNHEVGGYLTLVDSKETQNSNTIKNTKKPRTR